MLPPTNWPSVTACWIPVRTCLRKFPDSMLTGSRAAGWRSGAGKAIAGGNASHLGSRQAGFRATSVPSPLTQAIAQSSGSTHGATSAPIGLSPPAAWSA